jgi:hypothetical protein
VHGSWRSDLTAARFDRELAARGIAILERLSSWTAEGESYEVGQAGDVVTVFARAAGAATGDRAP